MPLSTADRWPPPAPAPPPSPLAWHHSPMPGPARRFLPTTVPPLPTSPAESLPPALWNHSLHQPPDTQLCPRVYSASPLPSTFPHRASFSCRLLCLPCSPPSHGPSAQPSSIANSPSSTATPLICSPPSDSTTLTSSFSPNWRLALFLFPRNLIFPTAC